jgi:glycosyltransferase involved in cell wall biosynthesis
MPTNVHIIHTRYPHWGKHSGFHQFLRYVDRKKFRLTVHAVSDNHSDFPVRNRALGKIVRSLILHGNMKWYKLSDLNAEMKLLPRCLGSDPPDVIHYLDGEHSARFLPKLLRAFPRKPPRIAATFHQPPGIIDDLIDRKIIGSIDIINVVSPDQVEYFSRIVDASRIRMILHGIDVDFFRPETHMPPTKNFRCVTVGHYLRDFNLLRGIYEKLVSRPHIQFELVSSRFKGLGRLPNVKIHQGIDDNTLRNLYRRSNLLLLPMRYATANNALLEGIACGLPVVATLLPGLKAYLPGREAFLVNDDSVDGFAEAILKVAQDPQYRQQMAAAARRRALELDWRKVTPLFENMYDELVHGI